MKSAGSKRIVLASSGQPGANPRLVKEAVSIEQEGYEVIVIYCPLSPWADEFDKNLFKKYPAIKWICVGVHPLKQPLAYKYIRLRKKLYALVYKAGFKNSITAIRSTVLFSQEILKETLKHKAHLYIGHNLGALPAVGVASKKYGARAIFDFEDYHRGEYPAGSEDQKKTELIENKFVPKLFAATTASPLITERYRQHFPKLNIQTINNCFPLSYRSSFTKKQTTEPLKLFWFSQFIGTERGIETVIEAIAKTGNKEIQLSLLGNITDTNSYYFKNLAAQYGLERNQIIFLAPVPENEIPIIAAQHHIGLACEVPHIPNREVCLTNKIFMYLLAGNAVMYSNTAAQKQFYQQHLSTGKLYNNSEELSEILIGYVDGAAMLNGDRLSSLQLATEEMNWEKEQKVLKNLVAEALQ